MVRRSREAGPLRLEYIAPEDLLPSPNNARVHPPRQLRALAKSIKAFGFLSPVVTDAKYKLLCGHGRVEAAKMAGLEAIPVVRADALSEAQCRAFMLADNRLSELGAWNRDQVAVELQCIIDLGLPEIEVTGFTLNDIDFRLDEAKDKNGPDTGPEDLLPEVNPVAVTRPGDVWILGKHVLLCGNALDGKSYDELLRGQKVDCVVTDAPFNLDARSIAGLGKHRHKDFAMAHGEMSEREFTDFLAGFLRRTQEASKPGSLFYLFMDWRHLFELQSACRSVGLVQKNLAVWVKRNAGMGTFYRSRHELILIAKHGDAPHLNTFELGQHGRYRSNVWEYAGNNSFHSDRDAELAMHPTAKPVALLADIMRDVTRRNAIILDPFGGSGSLLVAAEKTGRHARLIEIDPHYCDVIVRRFETYTGTSARLEKSGHSFEETRLERAAISENMPGYAGHGEGAHT